MGKRVYPHAPLKRQLTDREIALLRLLVAGDPAHECDETAAGLKKAGAITRKAAFGVLVWYFVSAAGKAALRGRNGEEK